MKRIVATLLCLFLAAPAFALTGISFGVKGGVVSNYEQAGLALGDFDLDQMNLGGVQLKISSLPVFNLVLWGDYAWKNKNYDFYGQDFQMKIHDLSFGASLVYPVKFQMVTPYLGGGVGSHHFSFDYIKPLALSLDENGITVPESVNRIGYHLVAGISIDPPAFPFGISAEYRMNWIDTPGEVTTYNSITAGLNFRLP
jgi:opacity protein-like surface antigen